MTRVVVVGDLMTDAVAHALYPLARGSDTAATVSMHGGGSGANIAAWLAVDGTDVAFVGRRGADIAGRNRDMELMDTASTPGWSWIRSGRLGRAWS